MHYRPRFLHTNHSCCYHIYCSPVRRTPQWGIVKIKVTPIPSTGGQALYEKFLRKSLWRNNPARNIPLWFLPLNSFWSPALPWLLSQWCNVTCKDDPNKPFSSLSSIWSKYFMITMKWNQSNLQTALHSRKMLQGFCFLHNVLMI